MEKYGLRGCSVSLSVKPVTLRSIPMEVRQSPLCDVLSQVFGSSKTKNSAGVWLFSKEHPALKRLLSIKPYFQNEFVLLCSPHQLDFF